GCDELGQRFELSFRGGCANEMKKTQTGDRVEILQRIVRQIVEQRDADRRPIRQQCQRMPIARRGDYGSSGGYPAGARLVFNVKPASKLAAKFLCNDARRDIGDST